MRNCKDNYFQRSLLRHALGCNLHRSRMRRCGVGLTHCHGPPVHEHEAQAADLSEVSDHACVADNHAGGVSR